MIYLIVISITWTEMLTFTLESTCLAVFNNVLKTMEKAKGALGQITSLQMGRWSLHLVTHSLLKTHKEKNRSRQLNQLWLKSINLNKKENMIKLNSWKRYLKWVMKKLKRRNQNLERLIMISKMMVSRIGVHLDASNWSNLRIWLRKMLKQFKEYLYWIWMIQRKVSRIRVTYIWNVRFFWKI